MKDPRESSRRKAPVVTLLKVFALSVFAPITLAQPLLVAIPRAEMARLVYSSERGNDRVDVAAGALKYVESADQEGYKPEQSILLTARRRSYVYDYRADVSAYQLADETENQLRRAGYQIVYRCQRAACGEIDGWKVFLGNAVSGVEATQYYVLARKNRVDNSASFVQIYANDIRQAPRLIANVYEGEVVIDAVDGLVQIPFSLNSAELTAGGRDVLRRFVGQLIGAGVNGIKAIEVSGYTDAVGDEHRNQQLSQQRADVIVRWLRGEAALRALTITARAGGIAGEAQESPASVNPYRRAEIKVLRTGDKGAGNIAAK
jgi:outer membrane protein OmpA-like peptidoglycan-associated protein